MAIQIKDIYAGKPDAKDEIDSEGLNPFWKTTLCQAILI